MTAHSLPNAERSFLLTSQRELTIADSTFSMYSIACFLRIVKENRGFAMDIRFCSLIPDKCLCSGSRFPWTV